jgi:GTP cyclohydrolase IA
MTDIITHAEIGRRAAIIAQSILLSALGEDGHVALYGVPRGGIPAAYAVAAALRKVVTVEVVDDVAHADVVVDDLIDSGRTSQRYTKPFYALFNKQREEGLGWLTFPWEVTEGGDTSGEDIVVRLLQYIGEDPEREGLKDTPQRVLKAWKEWAVGYDMDPGQVLKTFEDGADGVDEMVVVHNIPVISKCEHHLADITGIAHVGYIPNGRIVGLSKLARLVDVFARRLQVQERMTNQIAESLHEHLNPIGIGVVIRASHACMSTRGVKVHGSTTTTSAMRGALRNDQSARAEFLSLCRAAEG